jgi:hypothetical protein
VCASGACAACAGSAAITSAWLTSCVASAKRSVGIAARSATRGHRWPVREARMSLDCLVAHRPSGPCILCRQPAWPAHVRGLQRSTARCAVAVGGAARKWKARMPRRGAHDPAWSVECPWRALQALLLRWNGAGRPPDTTAPLPRPFRAVSGVPRGFLRAALPRLAGRRPALPPVATRGNAGPQLPGGAAASEALQGPAMGANSADCLPFRLP